MTKSSLHLIRGAQRQSGFTIAEIMIATLVFSVVLLLVTVGILQISRVYFKGITESNTQSTARNIIDTVSQAIQFSGGNVTTTPASPTSGTDYNVCIGNQQFSYRLGWEVHESPVVAQSESWHGMVQRIVAGCASSSTPQTLTNQTVVGRELVSQHMRLSNFSIQDLGSNQYKVTVRVVYGDDDLLYSPAAPTASDGPRRTDAKCKQVQAGTQFCAVSELSTVVVKRVE